MSDMILPCLDVDFFSLLQPPTQASGHFPLSPSSSQAVTSPPPQEPLAAFNDSKLKLHHGAIDQNAISSIPPPLIMAQLKKILWDLGIDIVEENSMKLKATRRSKKKVVASLGMGVFEALQQQQQQGTVGGAGLKSIFQRKPSSASVGPGVLIDQFGNVCAQERASGSSGPQQQPLPSYADDPSVDSGDDVRFSECFPGGCQ